MALKTSINYSPNFNPNKRGKNEIKFIIFHYTGMKKEKDAINKLTNIQSEVSSHYLIKKNGEGHLQLLIVLGTLLFLGGGNRKQSYHT